MKHSKGFTLVELVVVIAVTAVLATVFIAVMQNVIRAAEQSSENQKMYADELEQKSNDILRKADNSEWYGWEDVENSLIYHFVKDNNKTDAIAAVLNEHSEKTAENNTAITNELLVKIIKNSLDGKYRNTSESQKEYVVNFMTGDFCLSDGDAQTLEEKLFSGEYTLAHAADIAREFIMSHESSFEKKTYSEKEITAILNAATAQLLSGTPIEPTKVYDAAIFLSLSENMSLSLEDDIVFTSEITVPQGIKLELCLNGHTINLAQISDTAKKSFNVNGEMHIYGDGQIIVGNSGFNVTGKLTVDGGNFSYNTEPCDYLFSSDGGDITINGGNFRAFSAVIANNNGEQGEVVINGGYFENYDCSAAPDIIIYNSIFNCEVTINGGSFLLYRKNDLVANNAYTDDEAENLLCIFTCLDSCGEHACTSDGETASAYVWSHTDEVYTDDGNAWIEIK